MSADNWAECPKCKSITDKAVADVEKLYGKIPPREYSAKLGEAQKRLADRCNTLREDYEIGIYRGKFFVRYSGHCEPCGYLKEFKHEELVP